MVCSAGAFSIDGGKGTNRNFLRFGVENLCCCIFPNRAGKRGSKGAWVSALRATVSPKVAARRRSFPERIVRAASSNIGRGPVVNFHNYFQIVCAALNVRRDTVTVTPQNQLLNRFRDKHGLAFGGGCSNSHCCNQGNEQDVSHSPMLPLSAPVGKERGGLHYG